MRQIPILARPRPPARDSFARRSDERRAAMFNLFDILQRQDGGGMQSFGQQFGLSPDQSRRAMEALLPALTIGLQRNAAADPASFARLFGFAGTDPRAGAAAPLQPDMLLGQLFGSPALSQAVLQQAAAASGIGTQALRQMLPAMAGMIVAGIVHMMLNQPPPAPAARREPEPPPPQAFPAADFWNEWMKTFASSASPAPATEANPLQRPPLPPREAPARSSAPDRPAPSQAEVDQGEDAPLEVFQQMFQTGVQVQEQNVKAMQNIFESFWSGPSPETAPAEPDAATGDLPGKPSKPRRKPTTDKAH